MLSEGIHSLVDTGNGGLLFLGIKRSRGHRAPRTPSATARSCTSGASSSRSASSASAAACPSTRASSTCSTRASSTNPTINYIVLGLDRRRGHVVHGRLPRVPYAKGDRRALSAIHHGKDPSLFTVLFEDSAALAGLVVAFVGVFLGHLLHNPLHRRRGVHRHRPHPRRRRGLARVGEQGPARRRERRPGARRRGAPLRR